MRCINDALVVQSEATHSSQQLTLALWKQVGFPVYHHNVVSYFIQGEKEPPTQNQPDKNAF